MNTIQKKDKIVLRPGTIVQGKWHRNKYQILRLLGTGTVGSVYLSTFKRQLVALKISRQSLSMTAEVQVLKKLQQAKVQDSVLGPSLIDVDDWERPGEKSLSFYVMEFIDGVDLQTFIRRHGTMWLGVLLVQLLEQLEQLHKIGYVFGDLKTENIIVTNHPPTIRLIDVGGTTKMGRSVKEYTNFFDRAYWRLGKRIAEPSYDLFAVVMIFLSVFYPNKFTRTKDNLSLIRRKLRHVASLRHYEPIFLKALTGNYRYAKEMRHDIYKRIMAPERPSKKSLIKKHATEILFITCWTGFYLCLYFVTAK